MRRALPLLALALAAPPRLAAAEPAGPVVSLSLAGGAETGLVESQPAGVAEIAGTFGWDVGASGLRPELQLAVGVAPDGHYAIRPGISWSLPGAPFRVRAALDASTARERDLHWRWLLLGGAAELRLTGRLSFDAGLDLGIPLGNDIGIPLLLRVGSSLRF